MAAQKSLSTVAQTSLGDSGSGTVTTKVIQVQANGATGFSITVKGRIPGSGLTPVPLPYRRRYLNGAVGDEQFGSAAITGDSLIEVNADGIEVILDQTAITGGAVLVDSRDLTG